MNIRLSKSQFNTFKINLGLFMIMMLCISFNNLKAQTYCTPQYVNGCTYNDMITYVELNTLAYNSGTVCTATLSPVGYNDYTAVGSTTLIPGQSYQTVIGGVNSSAGVNLWVDYNDNGIFESTETIGNASNLRYNSTDTFFVNIPLTAIPGFHRLRVRSVSFTAGNTIDPCSVYSNGECEDYKVYIQALPPCSGAPVSGYATSSVGTVCANTSFDLNLSNGSAASGLLYQWQASPNGITWSPLGSSQTVPNFSITSIIDTMYYRCITTCTISAQTATSSATVVNLTPFINCYCLPSYSLNCGGDKFADFSLANISALSNNCDLSGYSDWTGISASEVNLNAGNTYILLANTLNSGFYGNSVMGAWIDYNQNNIFDSSEFTYLGYGAAGSYSNTLYVPINALSGSVRMRLKLDATYASASTTLDPCNNNNFANNGQILDYKVNIIAAPACSGVPNAGIAISTATAVCPNTPFTLDLSGNSISSGITYQWQSSLNGTIWTPLGSVQSTIPYSISTQSVSTYYRCVSTCTTSAPISSTSTPVFVSQNAPTTCYCTPQSLNCGFINITSLTIQTLTNSPVCNPNGAYTNNDTLTTIPVLNANQSYSISLGVNSQAGTAYVGLWLDYNQDGYFTPNEYTDAGSIFSGTLTPTINVPFTSVGGNTRMRVKLEANNVSAPILDPCTTSNYYGQVIDYIVNITPVASCSATPFAGNTSASDSTMCSNTSFTLNLVNNSIAGNISYQWQSSSNNVLWNDLGSAQSYVPYVILNQTSATYYRCITTCTASAITSTSSPVFVSQNTIFDCYCIPPASDCSYNDQIKYVLLSTISNTSACSSILNGDTHDGYKDYTSSVASATLHAGQIYAISVSVGQDFNEYVSAWIDYNQNGIFDTSEFTNLGSPVGAGNDTVQSSITIPNSATLGTTRMRLRNNRGMALLNSDACNAGGMPLKVSTNGTGANFGETEDYLVTIIAPDCGSVNLPPTIPVTGSTNICLGQSVVLDISTSIPVATGFSYQWKSSTGGSYSNVGPNATSFTTTPSTNTSYYCEISCNGTAIKNTDTLHLNVISITLAPVSSSSVCNGVCNGSIALNATSTSSLVYTWLPSSTSTTNTASGLCAGNYTATVTDVQGACSVTNTFVITQPVAFNASISGSSSSICEQLEDTIKSTINGGLAPFTYNWIQLPSTNISTSANYTYTTSIGTFGYSLTVTDANNCVANSNTISVTVNPSSNLSGTVTTNSVIPVAGRVILYKYLPFYTKFDSVAGQNIGATGDYNFVSFTSGIYIIKAVPSATNMQVAYGDSAVNWKTAKQINHGCAVNDIQNIQVKALQTFTPGPGTLTGIITQTLGYGHRPFGNYDNGSVFKPLTPGQPIGGIIVKGGRNPGGQMFVQTITSNDPTTLGTYTLTGLPYGNYFVLVDIPGLDTNRTYHVNITPTDTVFHNLDFTVDSIEINPLYQTNVGIHEINIIANNIKIYPNPTNSNLTVQYSLQASAMVKIELFDILGKSVRLLLPPTQQSKDAYKISEQLDDLKAGLYFIKININGYESTIKLSVTN